MRKVSIIMPVYNDADRLDVSIDSVVKQTLDDIELICVNDGSTDNSLDKLNEFAKKHDFIRVFSQENQGSGKARNYGLRESSGEYIAFLDADDIYIDEDALEKLYEVAIKNDAEIVSGNIKLINEKGEFSPFNALDYFTNYDVIPPEKYGIPWSFYKNIYKKDFLVENSIEFPDLLRGQDPVFLAEVLANVGKVYAVPTDCYAYFYVNGANQCNTRKKRFDHMMHYKMVFDYLNDGKFDKIRHEFRGQMISFINMMGIDGGKDILDATRIIFKDEPEILSNFEECFYFKHIKHDDLKKLVDFKIDEENPRISVIIPADDSQFIDDAIESVLNQSFTDFELICVTGDGNNELLNEYALNDKRIKLIQNNGNIASSRDIALKDAQGKYVCFINPNDKIPKNSLMESYKNAIYNDSDMVIFKAQTLDDDGLNDKILFELQKILPKKNYYKYTFDYTEVKSHVLNNAFMSCSKLYKKEFLNSFDDFKFDIGASFEEIPFHVKCMLRAKELSFVNKILYYSKDDDYVIDNYYDIFNIIDNVKDFLIDENLFDEFSHEFYRFEVTQILSYILAANSNEYYEMARKRFLSINKKYLSDNHENYDLVVEIEEFNEFKLRYTELLFLEEQNKLNDEIKYLLNQRSELQNENKKLEKQNSELKKLNDSILNSTCWKLTKPLRKIKNLR